MLIQSKSIFKQQGLINLKICTIMYYLHTYKFLSIQKNSDANSTANNLDKSVFINLL